MNFKRTLVRKLLDFADGWNHEIHEDIEKRVSKNLQETFPPHDSVDPYQREKLRGDMRSFYYDRISMTTNLLIAIATFVVALLALVMSFVTFFKC